MKPLEHAPLNGGYVLQLLPATERTRCANGQPQPGPVDASALMYGMDLFAYDNQSRPLDVEFVDGAEI